MKAFNLFFRTFATSPNQAVMLKNTLFSNKFTLLVNCILIAIAFWMGFSKMSLPHSSDTLMPSLMSLQKWTFFYWGQERLGSFLPLVLIPFKHPLTNYLVQKIIAIYFGFVCLFLIGRYITNHQNWIPIGCISAILMFNCLFQEQIIAYFINHYEYSISLTFALSGVLILSNKPIRKLSKLNILIGTFFFLLAHWVNISIILALGPLVFAHCFFKPFPINSSNIKDNISLLRKDKFYFLQKGKLLRELFEFFFIPIIFGCAFIANLIFSKFYRISNSLDALTDFRFLPVSFWTESWYKMAFNAWENFFQNGLMTTLGVFTIFALASLIMPQSRKVFPSAVFSLSIILLSAFIHILAIGTLRHMEINLFNDRYLFIPLVLIIVGIIAFSFTLIQPNIPKNIQTVITYFLLAGLLINAIYKTDHLSAADIKMFFHHKYGAISKEVVGSHSTHIIGNYWDVWPVVFYSNLQLYENDTDKQIWGLTLRGNETKLLWKDIPLEQFRIAMFHDSNSREFQRYIKQFDLPELRVAKKLNHISILEPIH